MTDHKVSNWVDRGEPPDDVLARILAFYFQRDLAADRELVRQWSTEILGMVVADATEVNIGGYLVALEDRLAIRDHSPAHRRAVAIALWHVGKCACLRDAVIKSRPRATPC